VCLPYRGVKWTTVPFHAPEFMGYINYEILRKNYSLFPGYINRIDTGLIVSVMESLYLKKDTVSRIYYDDESTLGLKYNFILESKLKGVAVNALGEDYGYSSLWDEMSYTFAMPDTVFLSGMAKRKLVKEEGLGFFQKQYRWFTLFNYILQNPCEICFENIKDSAKNEQVQQYLLDLDIYAKMKAANLERIKNGETPYRSQYQFVNARLTHSVLIFTIILIIILLALGILYFLNVKSKGDNWTRKKLVTRLMLANSILIVLFLFTFLFCNDNIMFFGSSASDKADYSKDYCKDYSKYYITDNGAPGGITSTTFDYCYKDPESDCINMPLQTLLGIIILGLIVGGILTRFLILPLLKRYEKP
jgi:ABC-type sugar transport system permease subunit